MSVVIWEGVTHCLASYLAEPSLRGLIIQNLARTQHHQNKRICTHRTYEVLPTPTSVVKFARWRPSIDHAVSIFTC